MRVPREVPRAERRKTLLFLVTEDWYFVSHRLHLARAAVEHDYRVLVATRVQDHAEQIRAIGAEVLPLPWQRRGAGPLGDVRALLELLRIYRRVRPDLVHHVALKPIVYGSFAARLAGTPAVINAVTGLGYVFIGTDWKARLLRPMLRTALRIALSRRDARAVFQNIEDCRAILGPTAGTLTNVRVIRGAGVDLSQFQATTPVSGIPIVMLPARMLWDKGVREFVDAAGRLRAAGVQARFILVGDTDHGNRASVPRHQLRAWQESGVVEWWGHRRDMPAVLAQASVVCLPSYREGLPKALLEAAACGRPIVATDTPGCRDVVRDGDNGLLVAVRDSIALAEALRRLIEQPDLRRAMGMRGRAIVEAEFSATLIAEQTLELYREMSRN